MCRDFASKLTTLNLRTRLLNRLKDIGEKMTKVTIIKTVILITHDPNYWNQSCSAVQPSSMSCQLRLCILQEGINCRVSSKSAMDSKVSPSRELNYPQSTIKFHQQASIAKDPQSIASKAVIRRNKVSQVPVVESEPRGRQMRSQLNSMICSEPARSPSFRSSRPTDKT